MTNELTEFAGDVLLASTSDGGDIVLNDGLIAPCRDFTTAAWLSLFGGNRDDVDGRANETWWGNLIPGTLEEEWMHSEFGALVEGQPLTAANLRRGAQAAERDLEWTRKKAGAESVEVSLEAESKNRVRLRAEIMQDGNSVGGGEYEFQWQGATR